MQLAVFDFSLHRPSSVSSSVERGSHDDKASSHVTHLHAPDTSNRDLVASCPKSCTDAVTQFKQYLQYLYIFTIFIIFLLFIFRNIFTQLDKIEILKDKNGLIWLYFVWYLHDVKSYCKASQVNL